MEHPLCDKFIGCDNINDFIPHYSYFSNEIGLGLKDSLPCDVTATTDNTPHISMAVSQKLCNAVVDHGFFFGTSSENICFYLRQFDTFAFS